MSINTSTASLASVLGGSGSAGRCSSSMHCASQSDGGRDLFLTFSRVWVIACPCAGSKSIDDMILLLGQSGR
jgi:hypothetical protein